MDVNEVEEAFSAFLYRNSTLDLTRCDQYAQAVNKGEKVPPRIREMYDRFLREQKQTTG